MLSDLIAHYWEPPTVLTGNFLNPFIAPKPLPVLIPIHLSQQRVSSCRGVNGPCLFSQEENHARAEVERQKQEQRLRERNRRQREVAEERRMRELKKKVGGSRIFIQQHR